MAEEQMKMCLIDAVNSKQIADSHIGSEPQILGEDWWVSGKAGNP